MTLHKNLLSVSLLIFSVFVVAADEAKPDPLLEKIGEWDGVTVSAELQGPYEDWIQQEIPFGRTSYYLSPWRAYMDTWPASKFLNCLGINFNLTDAKTFDPTAQLLAESGICTARVEFNWGAFTYDDPTKLPEHTQQQWTQKLQALKKHNIRPLILLNANSGAPCPTKSWRVKLVKSAEIGAREISIDKVAGIVTGYTGLRGQAYQVGFPLITKVDESGRCELSAPLKKELKEGPLDLFALKYQPFSGKVLEDGTANPAADETLKGWISYVDAVCKLSKSTLGTEGRPDAGFDLEVWNEYTFGSQFLNEKEYYNPPRKFKEPISYSAHGRTMKDHEIILPMTVDFVNDPANKTPGVKVISGFSNQRPWDSGFDMWPGQGGFSRHYYVDIEPEKIISPETEAKRTSSPINALGKSDGKPQDKDPNAVVPGSFFVPTLKISMPEWWHYGYKTELMTRNIQPFPGPWQQGGDRFSHPGDGHTAEVWMTETNLYRQKWADDLIKKTGCAKDDPRLIALMHYIGAKALLRQFVFYSHKGVNTIEMFAAHESDTGLAVINQNFFKSLPAENFALNDKLREAAGPQLQWLGRAVKLMKVGQTIETARPIKVEKLVEHKPRLVFKGDGTPEHPDRFNRDDFACLPFQLTPDQFAVAYYVVTRDITHAWNKGADLLDRRRYDMPEQQFDLTLSNVAGEGAQVLLFDPKVDQAVELKTLASTATTLTVSLPTTDYPRFILIEEKNTGPLILTPHLEANGAGALLSFSANITGEAKVTWGPLPKREKSKELAPPPGAMDGRGEGDLAKTKKVQVTRGQSVAVEIPELKEDEGVRITLEHNGIAARWPLWSTDVRGVLKVSAPKR